MTEHATKDYECDLLLHTCCGPCLEWPARLLLQEKQNLLIYYINPNIQPAVENKRRLENLKILTHKLGLELIADPICQPEIWQNWDDSVEARCRMCYRRRLQATADKAIELGIPAFSTTLLVSPWQDRDAIVEIGNRIARPAGLLFVDRFCSDIVKVSVGQRGWPLSTKDIAVVCLRWNYRILKSKSNRIRRLLRSDHDGFVSVINHHSRARACRLADVSDRAIVNGYLLRITGGCCFLAILRESSRRLGKPSGDRRSFQQSLFRNRLVVCPDDDMCTG